MEQPLSDDGKRIVVNCPHDRTRETLDADKGTVLFMEHDSSPNCLIDGNRMVSAINATLAVWDANREVEMLSLKGHTNEVTGVAISADRKRTVILSKDNSVKVWEAD